MLFHCMDILYTVLYAKMDNSKMRHKFTCFVQAGVHMYRVHLHYCMQMGLKANLWTVDKDQSHPDQTYNTRHCCITETQGFNTDARLCMGEDGMKECGVL